MVNLGSLGAFLGGNNGQGGAVPELQQLQQQAQQRQQQAWAMQGLQQLAQQGQSGAPNAQGSPILPNTTPMPSAAGVPPGAPISSPQNAPQISPMPQGAPPPAPGGPQVSAMPQGMAPQGSPAQQFDPMSYMNKQIAVVSNLPNLPDDQKFAVLQKMGAFTSPIEAYEAKLNNLVMQSETKLELARQAQENAQTIAQMKISAGASNVDKREEAATQTRDLNAIEKEMADARSEVTAYINAGKIDTPEYKAAKKDFDDLRAELETARKGGTATTKTAGKPAPAKQAAGGAPEGAPTATSADGKKVYWDGKSWTPVAGGQ